MGTHYLPSATIPVSWPWALTDAMSVVAKVAEKRVVECMVVPKNKERVRQAREREALLSRTDEGVADGEIEGDLERSDQDRQGRMYVKGTSSSSKRCRQTTKRTLSSFFLCKEGNSVEKQHREKKGNIGMRPSNSLGGHCNRASRL